MTTWHADDADLTAYAAGACHPVTAASVDAHLPRCGTCRAGLARLSEAADTNRRWARVADAVDRPSPSLAERLGVPHGAELRRTALGAPAMRWAWAGALALVLAIPLTAVLTFGTGARGLAVLLAAAPLAPAAAVALAYRQSADPAGEMTLATPAAGVRLVAMRALVVAAGAVPLGLGVGAMTGVPAHLALAWLLPGLALAALVLLAGTTRLDPLAAAGVLGGGWAVAVLAPAPVRGLAARHVVETVASPSVQVVALAVVMAALALTAARRDAVAYRRTA